MLESQKGKQLATRIVKVAENLEQAQDEIDYIESALARVDEQAEELETVDDILSAIESDIASIEALTSDELTELSEAAKLTFVDLPPDRMQRNSRLDEGADPLEVLKTLFQSEIEEKLRNDSFRMALKWEPFDYWAVGTAGLLAAVTDFFLVGLPAGVHAGPITAWLKSFNSNKGGDCLSLVAQEMERVCKVPYDTLKGTESIAGMCGRTHRFQSLGHDPVVGFVFGVLDILRGSITAFSYDQLTRAHKFIRTESPSGVSGVTLIEAFLLQLGHLVSDVATPSGLPAPFTPLLQAINAGRFGPGEMTVAEVARWMYGRGYDLRHFLASGVSLGTGQAVLSGLLLLRELTSGDIQYQELKTTLKFQRMTFTMTCIATLGNAGKITLLQGNPLAINQAQWMRFFGQLGPQIKSWLLQDELELERLRKLNRDGWANLT